MLKVDFLFPWLEEQGAWLGEESMKVARNSVGHLMCCCCYHLCLPVYVDQLTACFSRLVKHSARLGQLCKRITDKDLPLIVSD